MAPVVQDCGYYVGKTLRTLIDINPRQGPIGEIWSVFRGPARSDDVMLSSVNDPIDTGRRAV